MGGVRSGVRSRIIGGVRRYLVGKGRVYVEVCEGRAVVGDCRGVMDEYRAGMRIEMELWAELEAELQAEL